MRKLMIVALAVSGLVYTGCNKKSEAPAAGTTDSAKPAAALPAPGNPNDVIVAVGDAKLTRGELDADIAKIIDAQKGQIPPEQLEQAKSYLAEQFKQQFVTKTVLMNEAAKKGLSVTDDEVVARAAGAEAVLVNKVSLTEGVIAALPGLRYIGVLATGYDNIDLAAAKRRGITVTNAPGYSTSLLNWEYKRIKVEG